MTFKKSPAKSILKTWKYKSWYCRRLDLSYNFLPPMGFPKKFFQKYNIHTLLFPVHSFHRAHSQAMAWQCRRWARNIQLFQHIQLIVYIIWSKKHQLNGKLFIKLNFYFYLLDFLLNRDTRLLFHGFFTIRLCSIHSLMFTKWIWWCPFYHV